MYIYILYIHIIYVQIYRGLIRVSPRNGLNIRAITQAVSRAVRYVNTHRPRFQIWARPS